MYKRQVEGANGGLHTNYAGKAEAAVKALTEEGYDFVYIHVEAPDEMGHQGSVKDKIKAIEYIDAQIIGCLLYTSGFSKAYQKETGIAGYTLIYNSYGLLLVAHEPFESTEAAIEKESDIHSEMMIVKRVLERRLVGRCV